MNNFDDEVHDVFISCASASGLNNRDKIKIQGNKFK